MLNQADAKYVEDADTRKRLYKGVDEAFMLDDAFIKGYRWGSAHKVLHELEILRSYFLLKQGSLAIEKVYSPEIVLLSCYKSLLTCIVGDSKVFDIENASPLKIVGFFKGAIEALKHRKMISRRREENLWDLHCSRRKVA